MHNGLEYRAIKSSVGGGVESPQIRVVGNQQHGFYVVGPQGLSVCSNIGREITDSPDLKWKLMQPQG